MKKKIGIILVIILIISTTYMHKVLALGMTGGLGGADIEQGMTTEKFQEMMEQGTATVNGGTQKQKQLTSSTNQNDFSTKIIYNLIIILPKIAHATLTDLTSDSNEPFTIENILINKYDIFNLEYLMDGNSTQPRFQSILSTISENMAIWYFSIRNMAMVGVVLAIIYVGIRMAIGTVAERQARYKKMLMGCVEGIVILTFLHFIITFLMILSNEILNLIIQTVDTDVLDMQAETKILDAIVKEVNSTTSLKVQLYYGIMYTVFIYYQLKFFIMYLYRTLRVVFYIVIGPLISMGYIIDKANDGKAQTFIRWIREFSLAIFLQPLHLIVYIIFIYSAGEIFIRQPLLGIIFLFSLGRTEKIVREVLGFTPKLGKALDDINLA